MNATFSRRLYVFAGRAEWGRRAAGAVVANEQEVLWIGEGAPEQVRAVAACHAVEWLGSEVRVAVYDAHAGFDADALGAVAGTVRGGGYVILLTPALRAWPDSQDPYCARVATPPYTSRDVTGRFVARFARLLRGAAGVTVIHEGEPLPSIPAASPDSFGYAGECRTDDQRAAVEAIVKVVRGHRQRPLILTSDRGRGKSAALGIAAARLLREGVGSVLVTGPSLQAVAPVFTHAARLLPEASSTRGVVQLGGARLEFVAPDALTRAPRATHLLLVDEAAAIPTALLRRMLAQYARVVFATTVHGYEGTGRGFALRFQRELASAAPSHRTLVLREPVRWAANDALEQFIFRALMLDAEPADETLAAGAHRDACTFETMDREALAQDEEALRQLFGLLVLAHYRTTPGDLRDLLDGPNLSVHVVRYRHAIVGAALVARERLDSTLAAQVYEGRRRVRGNLLPQTLVYHLGLAHAAELDYARVVRIAIHPAAQGRGIGRALLACVAAQARDTHDIVGASFGATPSLLRWWRRAGFIPVRVGQTREASSGLHAAIVLRALRPRGAALCREARSRLLDALPLQLCGVLHDLDPHVAAQVLRSHGEYGVTWNIELTAQDRRDLHAFAHAARAEEVCLPALRRLALQTLARPDEPPGAEARAILVWRVLQGHRGRGESARALRVAVDEALRADPDAP